MACCEKPQDTGEACCEKPDAHALKAVANVHIHLHTDDLKRATAFYEKFLGEAPVKSFADYTKFLPSWAPLNLALTQLPGKAGSVVSHFGIQVGSAREVRAQLARIKSAGLEVREEIGVDCCHANQDKFWVVDPMGVEWEVYYLNYDVEQQDAKQNAACCEKNA